MRRLPSAHLKPALLEQKPVLLLNISTLSIRTFVNYITANPFSGAAARVPTEIWLNIIEYAKPKKEEYEAVQPVDMISSGTGTILHCRVIKLDFHTWNDRYEVTNTDQWLKSPHTYDQGPGNDYKFEYRKTDTVYAVSYPSPLAAAGASTSTSPPLSPPACLFTAVTVPDLIARLEDGDCWVCEGKRDVCPGCTGGKAQKFDADMGCGVSLACPLCMGIEFMEDHKRYLEAYYYVGPPADLKAEWDEELRDRKAELGYLED